MADPGEAHVHPAKTAGGQTRGTQELPHPALPARRATVAGLVGATIERYDFIIYGLAAGLVFGTQFFPSFSPVAGTLASLGAFLVGFLVRPIVTKLIVQVRLRESPACERALEARLPVRFPLGELVRRCSAELIAGTLAVTAAPSVGLLLYVYLIPYGPQVLHIPVTIAMLVLSTISAVGILVAIRVSAR
jgi:hypothetical protein